MFWQFEGQWLHQEKPIENFISNTDTVIWMILQNETTENNDCVQPD